MQEFQARQTRFQRLCKLGAAARQIGRAQPGTRFQLGQELFENADNFTGRLQGLLGVHGGSHTKSSACSSRRS